MKMWEDVDDDPQKLENELKHVINLIENLFSIWEEDMQDMEEIFFQTMWKLIASYKIDWIEFYALSAIFQPCYGGEY